MAGSTGRSGPSRSRTQPPSPSRSQYIGGSAPVSATNPAKAALVTGVRSISKARARPRGAGARCRRRSPPAGAPISCSPPATATISGPVGDRLGRRRRVALDRLVALDHLQQLQHRLVVLVLVGDQHLVDEAVARAAGRRSSSSTAVEDLQRALAHLRPCRRAARRRAGSAARCGSRAGSRSRRRGGRARRPSARAPPTRCTSHSSSKLAMWPRSQVERAEDRRVDAVELLVGERLDQQQGPFPRLGQAVGDPLLEVGLRRRGDDERLPATARSATRAASGG